MYRYIVFNFYAQRSRTSFFNKCMEKVFFMLTNKYEAKIEHENEAEGP